MSEALEQFENEQMMLAEAMSENEMLTSDTEVEGPADAVADFKKLLDEFVTLEQRRRDCDGELETIGDKIKAIEPVLREQFAALGMQNARCRGLTVFVKTDRYVSKKSEADGVTTEALIEALRKHGMGYLVKEGYSASALKAKVMEWLLEGQEVPAGLASLLNIGESKKLATRK